MLDRLDDDRASAKRTKRSLHQQGEDGWTAIIRVVEDEELDAEEIVKVGDQ
jgi:hypothetical protein